ncbi:unnamed protein product [Lactuca virosa]|uniref:Uncharacterized protein n=1 Tax=Lactuca virosa TaxID=75947 RepID=A0AAU9PRV7_9ASTR|nr:unnamed protein product [Lactuca virosa]
MEAHIEQLQTTVRKPPQAIPVTDESPAGSDKDDSNASLMPRKRRRQVNQVDQSQIVEPAQPAQVNQDDQSPNFNEDFLANEETFASGSSSAPPPAEHDSASVMLAKLLAFQESIPQSRGKGISCWLKARRVSELQKENSEKSKKISELQANLRGVTTLYFDLKDKLIGKCGDDFKSSVSDDGKASETSQRVVVRHAQDSNLDQFLSFDPVTAEERREKQRKVDEATTTILVQRLAPA